MTKELTLNKIAAGLVGVAMMAGLAFAAAAERAHAVSLGELVELFIALDIISEDKADEARAAIPADSGSTSKSSMSCNFTRNLTTGDTGADVMDLQKLLNANGFTVAAAGAGSAGNETQYFGPATAGAVAKMQEAFAADILTPLGLTAGTGYFGASTRAKANTLCSDDMPDTPDMDDEDEDMDEDENDTDLSGEASLKSFEMNSADDDEIQEGAEEVVVAEATMEFDDGDALVKRMDVSFTADGGNDELDPWDVFETVSLWVDGDMVAEKDADSKSDYLDEDNGTLRFSGLDFAAMEDEEVDVLIAVTLFGSLTGVADDEVWNVGVNAIRFMDADDVTTTDDTTGDLDDTTPVTVDFTIEEEGADDEIIVRNSSADPDSSIIKVEDDSKTDWVTVFVFDLDTDDSVNDILLDNVFVTVNTPGTSTYSGLVDDARLIIDGETIDSTLSDVTNPNTATAVIDFDVDGDVEIDAGDRVEAELQLRFKALAAGDEGATVQAEVTAANANAIDAEGADDLTNTGVDQLRGSAAGEVHQLYTAGIFAEIVSTDTDSEGTDGNIGVFEIKFDVTAFEGDYYIHANAASTTPGTGARYGLGGVGAESDSGTLSSTAEEVATDIFEVKDGQTETFTLKVNVEVPVAGDVRVTLDGVFYADNIADADDSGAVTEHTASPVEDFRTDYQLINA